MLKSLIDRLRRHWKQGTLADAMLAKIGIVPKHSRVKWYGTKDANIAVRTLTRHAQCVLSKAGHARWVLSLGDGNAFHNALNKKLETLKISYKTADIREILTWDANSANGLAAIYCGYSDTRRITQSAMAVKNNTALRDVPFEYVSGMDAENRTFERLDEYDSTCFVSPVLLSDPSPYAIYEESLKYFEQKCGLRDYLDLYQVILLVVQNDVPGDVAEFGSYKGHSGWLIARTLQALGSSKRLYMFDTFETFPNEDMGIDKFWSQTHVVNFDEVNSKLAHLDNVKLIKGDFTQTLAKSGISQLALAYIDCDSYRATRFLFDVLLEGKLSFRGAIICEDYGHPALLGNRLAVQEGISDRKDLVRFFSQFSGLYIAFKT